ncbi:MAG: transporter substrate-binding domain-containing protein [Spongiibacteraceae bacterium]|nr:transporter substrate-binding domain-containing protein [Spongiibacteraceae bacterium]
MNINFIPIKPFSIRNIQLIFILSFTLLFACGQKQTQLPEPETNKTPNTETVIAKLHPYIEKGDFQTLQQRGVIRLLIPRFDSTQELPRHGLPVQAYQALAERFVESLNLTPQWIFVDSFDSLLSDLKAGKGDLVITNLSVTAQREQHAKFSLALTAIDEVLIIHKDTNANSLDALNGLTITIPVGTAYEETLTKLKKQHPDLIIELNKNNLSDTQLLQQIDTGKITATVIDSDVANLLLPLYPLLRKGPTLKKNRPIAWAVRKNNLQLQRLLNEFLVAEHIQSNRNQAIHRDWEQIKANKKIRMLTLNNPSSYFMWRGELMGFDYDLMQEFARQHQLRLEVIVKNNINDLLEALQQGEGDLIAASLSVTPERAAAGVIFSRRYMSIREQLISLASEPAIETIEQLAGKRVAVNPQTSFYPRLLALKNQGIDFQIVTKPGIATEVLINGLNDGDYEFTVADSHLASIEQSYRNDLRINLDLSEDVEIAWGLRADQPELVKTLNAFIKKQYRGLFYNVTFKKYFVSTKNIHRHKKYRVTTEGAL